LAAALAICASGCSPKQPDSKVSSSSQAAPIAITQINVGQSAEASQAAYSPLTPESPVVVSLVMAGTPKNNKIEGKLFSLSDGKLQGSQALVLEPVAKLPTELVFKSPAKWDVGRYLVEVYLDGKMVGQKELEIVDLPASPQEK
jgi:hypothetical protein